MSRNAGPDSLRVDAVPSRDSAFSSQPKDRVPRGTRRVNWRLLEVGVRKELEVGAADFVPTAGAWRLLAFIGDGEYQALLRS